jgi:chromosome segregation ATPase
MISERRKGRAVTDRETKGKGKKKKRRVLQRRLEDAAEALRRASTERDRLQGQLADAEAQLARAISAQAAKEKLAQEAWEERNEAVIEHNQALAQWSFERSELIKQAALAGEAIAGRTALASERDSLRERLRAAEDEVAFAQEHLVSADRRVAHSVAETRRLAEREAAASASLAAAESKIAALAARLDGAELREEFLARFRADAGAYFEIELPPGLDAPEVLERMRQRLRETERSLDRVEAERDRLQAQLDARIGAWVTLPFRRLRHLFGRSLVSVPDRG